MGRTCLRGATGELRGGGAEGWPEPSTSGDQESSSLKSEAPGLQVAPAQARLLPCPLPMLLSACHVPCHLRFSAVTCSFSGPSVRRLQPLAAVGRCRCGVPTPSLGWWPLMIQVLLFLLPGLRGQLVRGAESLAGAEGGIHTW